jgi:ribosome maturation factor RimP
MDRARLDVIIEAASEALAQGGYECIEAEWESGDRILRLYVDCVNPEGHGMNLEECVKASKLLDASGDLDNVVAGPFALEVSSPGIERPLRKKSDFEKHIGQMVEVKLAGKVQERKHGKGRLVDVLNENGNDVLITLETSRGPWQFPLVTLQRASLVYDWGNS